MYFELRFYDLALGRSKDMTDRMTNDLTRIFARNGVPLAGAWLVEAGPRLPQIAYLVTHENAESASVAWHAFYADPDWHETRERTNAGSELVERGQVVHSTPMPEISVDKVVPDWKDAADELVLFDLAPSTTRQAVSIVEESLNIGLREAGALVLGAMNVTSGLHIPTLGIFLRWENATARYQGRTVLDDAQALRPGAPMRGVSRIYLAPVDGLHVRPGLQPLQNLS